MRIAVLTPIPTPYRDPFWNVVASLPGIELDVFYCAEGKPDRPWETSWDRTFRRKVLPGWNLNSWRAESSLFWNRQIYRVLSADYNAALIGGYNHLTMLSAMHICRRRGIPYYLMCETYGDRNSNTIWARAKNALVRRVLRYAAGGLPTGTLAMQYLVQYGLPGEKQLFLPNVPDIERIRTQVSDLRCSCRSARERLKPGKQVLFVGRLIPKKRVQDLVAAFEQVAATSTDSHLTIVGDGPLRTDLESDVARRGLTDRVSFVGFVQPRDLLQYWAIADLFVLPSNETWGVAVIEALAAGIPVVISDRVGCHVDVLRNPDAGMVFRYGDIDDLAHAIRQSLEKPASPDKELAPENWAYQTLAEKLVNWIVQQTSHQS